METKVCSKCKEEKPLMEFGKGNKYKNGVRSSCKNCNNTYVKDWRSRNLTKTRFYQMDWARRNLEAKKRMSRDNHKRYVSTLCDSYVKRRLKDKGYTKKYIDETAIKIQRVQLKIKRILNQKKNENTKTS